MAEDLFRYIVKNDLGRCTLLGHSMGGRTVMSFASKYPELVDKLIVVDVSPVTYGPKHYEYHLNLMRDLKKLDLNKIRSRKEAEAEASKYIDVRSIAPPREALNFSDRTITCLSIARSYPMSLNELAPLGITLRREKNTKSNVLREL